MEAMEISDMQEKLRKKIKKQVNKRQNTTGRTVLLQTEMFLRNEFTSLKFIIILANQP